MGAVDRKEGIADGEHIREYLTDTAHKYGIDRHIEFNSYVRSADWDSTTDTWTVTCEQNGTRRLYRSRFVFFGSGYYNYDEGYTPDFPGTEQFSGTVIHPQHWPEDLDYSGKKIVVIGSGATAADADSVADRPGAQKVTMLQRSPTYMVAASQVRQARRVLTETLAPQGFPFTHPDVHRSDRDRVRFRLQQGSGVGASGRCGTGRSSGCPKATTSTSISSRATTRGTNECA